MIIFNLYYCLILDWHCSPLVQADLHLLLIVLDSMIIFTIDWPRLSLFTFSIDWLFWINCLPLVRWISAGIVSQVLVNRLDASPTEGKTSETIDETKMKKIKNIFEPPTFIRDLKENTKLSKKVLNEVPYSQTWLIEHFQIVSSTYKA